MSILRSAVEHWEDVRVRVTVDIGKSGSRTRLGGDPRNGVEGPGIDPSVAGRPDGAARVVQTVAEDVNEALAISDVREAVTSLAISSTAVPADAGLVVSHLGRYFPIARVGLFTDHTVAHAAALGAPGVVATVGTGVAIVGLSADGVMTRIDGWGPDLGDRGSAWQIGRDGLRAGFAARDGVGPATALEDAAEQFCGGMDLAAAVRLLAAEGRVARVASFARVVGGLDDDVARGILASAAVDLTAGVEAAMARSGTGTVAFRGRLLLSEAYRRLVDEGCRRRDWEVRAPRSEVLEVDHDLLFADPYRRWALALREP